MAVAEYSANALGRCRGNNCRQPILWCETVTGSLMPVDVEETDRGNVEIVGVNQYGHPKVVVHHEPPMFHEGSLHMPHHATCADVGDFR